MENRDKFIRLAILASGGGSNADAICRYFRDHSKIRVGLIISNNQDAGVLNVADKWNVKSQALKSSELNNPEILISYLESHDIHYIILAGYLKLIPVWLIDRFENKILNIHPSLLPKYGGKGMYGSRVHEAVCVNKEKTSGITIHVVNHEYDQGKIVFQQSIKLNNSMTATEIAERVLKIEHANYAPTIEKFILEQV